MKGKLKKGDKFRIGRGYLTNPKDQGKVVSIIKEEDHPIWGKRYMLEGHDDWFEESCFEWISQ